MTSTFSCVGPAAVGIVAPAARPRAPQQAAGPLSGARIPRVHVQRRAQRVAGVVVAAAGAGAPAATAPHLQLATAKLPSGVNRQVFVQQMYQWAATLTTNGRNLPFALPLKTDPVPDGFQISLLRVGTGGSVLSVADVFATVEAVPGTGDVLMVRFYEGEAADLIVGKNGAAAGTDQQQRLKTLLSALVDVPLIMQTMPAAIKRSCMVAR